MKLERKGREDGVSARDAILNAAEAVMAEEGASAATSRRVAEVAGLQSSHVHYYFRTMDDLFVAVFARSNGDYFVRLAQAAEAERPLRALWDLIVHPRRTRMSLEFLALANRSEAIRTAQADVMERLHLFSTAFFERYLAQCGEDMGGCPPLLLSHMLRGTAWSLVNDDNMGVVEGRDAVMTFIDGWIDALEEKRAARLKA